MRRILLVLTALIVAVPVAIAQDSLPDTEAGRYVLRRVDGGLMRVERETGITSFCRKRDRSWTCELVADDRVVLEDEIARLAEDNSALAIEIGRLKDRIAKLEARVDAAPETENPDPKPALPGLNLPSDEEMDQVMKSFESMMHRFLDMMRDLREEYDSDRT